MKQKYKIKNALEYYWIIGLIIIAAGIILLVDNPISIMLIGLVIRKIEFTIKAGVAK